MKTFLESFVKETKQNPENYLIIFLALTTTLFDILGFFSTDITITLTLTLIALLAWGQLTNRRLTQELIVSIKSFDELGSTRVILAHPQRLHEIETLIKQAQKQIYIVTHIGFTLSQLDSVIRSALQRGCHIKLVVCDCEPSTIAWLKLRGYTLTTEEAYKSRITATRLYIRSMTSAVDPRGQLFETREIGYIPHHMFYLSDPGTLTGLCFAQLGTFRTPSDAAVALRTEQKQNPELFEFFVEQFNQYWNAATPVDLDQPCK